MRRVFFITQHTRALGRYRNQLPTLSHSLSLAFLSRPSSSTATSMRRPPVRSCCPFLAGRCTVATRVLYDKKTSALSRTHTHVVCAACARAEARATFFTRTRVSSLDDDDFNVRLRRSRFAKVSSGCCRWTLRIHAHTTCRSEICVYTRARLSIYSAIYIRIERIATMPIPKSCVLHRSGMLFVFRSSVVAWLCMVIAANLRPAFYDLPRNTWNILGLYFVSVSI